MVVLSCAAATARADQRLDHVVTAPTGWLPAAGEIDGWTGIDHHGDRSIDLGVGLGGIAAVDVGADQDVRRADEGVTLGRAGFRVGLKGVVLGTRATFAGHGRRVSDVYVAGSVTLGRVTLHGGLDAMDAKPASDGAHLGATVRPTAAIELVPPQYPKTTLMADLAWVPRFDADGKPGVERTTGFGVRYQALSWGAIELDVRAREGEDFSAARVMVRLDGVLAR